MYRVKIANINQEVLGGFESEDPRFDDVLYDTVKDYISYCADIASVEDFKGLSALLESSGVQFRELSVGEARQIKNTPYVI